jgi:hypothetical protein
MVRTAWHVFSRILDTSFHPGSAHSTQNNLTAWRQTTGRKGIHLSMERAPQHKHPATLRTLCSMTLCSRAHKLHGHDTAKGHDTAAHRNTTCSARTALRSPSSTPRSNVRKHLTIRPHNRRESSVHQTQNGGLRDSIRPQPDLSLCVAQRRWWAQGDKVSAAGT